VSRHPDSAKPVARAIRRYQLLPYGQTPTLVDGDDHLMGVNGGNEASSTDQFKALQFRLNWRWCRLQLIREGPMESKPNHLSQEEESQFRNLSEESRNRHRQADAGMCRF